MRGSPKTARPRLGANHALLSFALSHKVLLYVPLKWSKRNSGLDGSWGRMISSDPLRVATHQTAETPPGKGPPDQKGSVTSWEFTRPRAWPQEPPPPIIRRHKKPFTLCDFTASFRILSNRQIRGYCSLTNALTWDRGCWFFFFFSGFFFSL